MTSRLDRSLIICMIIYAGFTSCAPNNRAKSERIDYQKVALAKISALGLEREYDAGKWLIYIFKCDDTCQFFNNSMYSDTLVTCGMLDLKLTEVELHNDTADLYYNFYIDSTVCDERICRVSPYTGIAFDITTHEPIGLIDIERRSRFTITSGADRKMKFPETPRLKEYLRNNQNLLSPWLKRAAQNKGYI